jgi:hypothetical protein
MAFELQHVHIWGYLNAFFNGGYSSDLEALVRVSNYPLMKVISISIHVNVLSLTSEVSLAVDSMHDNSYEILNLAFFHIIGWPNFGALVMSVATIVHEHEAYYYHAWFLWKMDKLS